MKTSKNKVVGAHRAIVDGCPTGLAGCSNAGCERKCLRKDAQLALREPFPQDESACRYLIPIEQATA